MALFMLSCLGLHATPREHSVGTRLAFPLGRTEVRQDYKGNADAFRLLDEAIADGASVSRIEVLGVSSPEGSFAGNRRLAGERAQQAVDFLKARFASLPDSLFAVKTQAEDWAGVERYLVSSDKSWKEEALRIVRGPAAKRKTLLQELWVGEAWDDLLVNAFPRMRRAEIQVFLKGDPAPGKRILFRSGYRYFVESDPGNAEILQAVREKLQSGYSGPISLTGYSSPDGSAAANEKLALARAQQLKDYLVKELAVPEERVAVENGGVDWAGFAATVKNSYYGAHKSRVLEILGDQDLSNTAKKRALIALQGGKTWAELKKSQMPFLCAVDVSCGEGRAEEPPAVKPEPEPEPVPEPEPEPVVQPEPEPELVVVQKPVVEPEVVPEHEPVPEPEPEPEPERKPEPKPEPEPEPVVVESPGPKATLQVEPKPFASAGNTLLGVGTNLLYDAVTAANVSLDIPLGKHMDLTANFMFPWWKDRSKDFAFQIVHLDLGARYYFKGWEQLDQRVFNGWFVSGSAGLGYYDIAPWGDGVQGEEIKFSLGGGYTWKLGNWWRLSAELGVGGLFSRFRSYEAQSPTVLMVKNQGDLIYWGPTNAQVSLTYLLHKRVGAR